jgi:hypothetical protein
VRVAGGASFLGLIGTVTVSWPLATLDFNDNDVSVNFRSRLACRFSMPFLGKDATSGWSSLAATRAISDLRLLDDEFQQASSASLRKCHVGPPAPTICDQQNWS